VPWHGTAAAGEQLEPGIEALASWAAESVRSLAAASSMASGMPSRARQIRVTSPALVSFTVNPGRTAAARSASSLTAA